MFPLLLSAIRKPRFLRILTKQLYHLGLGRPATEVSQVGLRPVPRLSTISVNLVARTGPLFLKISEASPSLLIAIPRFRLAMPFLL